jgi:ABC-2 type transport system ATP-binding protein
MSSILVDNLSAYGLHSNAYDVNSLRRIEKGQTMASAPPAVALRGVRKAFGKNVVLEGLDLDVARGSVFALLGPNGAGKTTTIDILSTLVSPDAGTVHVNGFDAARQPEQVKASISVTGQSAAVDEVLSGDENLRMMGRLSGLTGAQSRRRAAELLDRFGIRDAGRRRVGTWSGGMRRKLDLAISLLRTPPVIFLDEPTTGLDTRSRQELWGMIRDLAADGTTVVLTTQYLEEADVLADRIAVLDHGRIVAEGTAAELKARTGARTLDEVFLAVTGADAVGLDSMTFEKEIA